jgi:TetR/AcrR family transcriptional regulator
MQEIADQAGINKALLHYYFRSKENLFDAVFNKLAGVMFSKLFICFENVLQFNEQISLFYKENISFYRVTLACLRLS